MLRHKRIKQFLIVTYVHNDEHYVTINFFHLTWTLCSIFFEYPHEL